MYHKLKTAKEHYKQRSRAIEKILVERDRRADTDRDMGRAVEQSLIAHSEALEK